jgi:hypothetical protein
MVFDIHGQLGTKGFQLLYLLVDFRYTSNLFGDIFLDLDSLVRGR